MESSLEMMGLVPDSDFDLLRELLSYDVQCPTSCELSRNDGVMNWAVVGYVNSPSPLHWSRQVEWPWAIRMAELKPHHQCLDIGSGWAVLKFAIAKRCYSVTCAEPDPIAIEKAQDTIDRLPFTNIHQIQADGRDLYYFSDEEFDRVFLISVAEHIPERQQDCFKEAVRVLKPGGVLLATMDLVTKGEKGVHGDFYLDFRDGIEIAMSLGLTKLYAPSKMIGSPIMDDKLNIAVMMLRYVKPLQ